MTFLDPQPAAALSSRLTHLVIFVALNAIGLFCCFHAHRIDNGYTDGGVGDLMVEQARYCDVCACLKGYRVHHCRRCNRCILRMDHHCPWIANCVGQNNYKVFLLFLFYITLACVQFFVIFARFVVHCTTGHRLPNYAIRLLAITVPVSFLIALTAGLAVGGLLIWNVSPKETKPLPSIPQEESHRSDQEKLLAFCYLLSTTSSTCVVVTSHSSNTPNGHP